METKNKSLKIDESTHHKLKTLAVSEKITIPDMVTILVDYYLEHKTMKLSEFEKK